MFEIVVGFAVVWCLDPLWQIKIQPSRKNEWSDWKHNDAHDMVEWEQWISPDEWGCLWFEDQRM